MSITYIVIATPGKLLSARENQHYLSYPCKLEGFRVNAGEEAMQLSTTLEPRHLEHFESIVCTLNSTVHHSDKLHVIVDLELSVTELHRIVTESMESDLDAQLVDYVAAIIAEIDCRDMTIHGFDLDIQMMTFERGAAEFRKKFVAQLKGV
jgi:hypothetical protein